MKGWVKGFCLVGTGVWDRPAPGAALYSSGALWGAQEPIATLAWQAALLVFCAHVVLLMVFFSFVTIITIIQECFALKRTYSSDPSNNFISEAQ